MTIAMSIVGSSIVVGKLVTAHLPIFLVSGLRFLIASAILFPMLMKTERKIPSVLAKDKRTIFVQTFSGVFLFNVFMLYGLKMTSGIEGGIIMSTTPAVAGVISFFFLKEKLTKMKGIGIVLAVLGTISINLTGTDAQTGTFPILGNVLIFGAVIGEALFIICGKAVSARLTPLAISTFVSLVGFFMFLPFAIFEAVHFDFSKTTVSDWGLLLYFGVFVTVVAFLLMYQGVAKVPANIAAVFTGILPVSAILLSCIFLKEPFLLSHLAGILLVLAGIFVSAKEPVRKTHGESYAE